MLFCPCSSDSVESEGRKPLEQLLNKVIKGFGPQKRVSAEEMAELWNGAVGAKASAHAQPVAMQKGVLTVHVDDSSWLYELTLQKKAIIQKLTTRLKGKKLKDVRFRIGELK